MVKIYFNVQHFVCTNLICTSIFKTQHVYRCNKNNIFSAFLLYDKYICFLLTKLSIKIISGTDLLTLDLIRVMALLTLAITEFPHEREITLNCHCCNWRIKMQLQAQHEIKRKITFDESSIKKEFSHFTYSHGVWFMQSSDSSQVQTIVKNLCPYKKKLSHSAISHYQASLNVVLMKIIIHHNRYFQFRRVLFFISYVRRLCGHRSLQSSDT